MGSPWVPYFGAMAGVAAALTGLVFVAVSINLAQIIKQNWLVDRAAESLLQLFGAAIISTLALIPQLYRPLGFEVLGVSLVLWLIQLRLQVRYLRAHERAGHPPRWARVRIIQTLLAYVPLFIGGELLTLQEEVQFWPSGVSGGEGHVYWLAIGLTFSLVAGVSNAWVLLIEILR